MPRSLLSSKSLAVLASCETQVSMSILQDERKPMMLVRYVAMDRDVRRRTGVLGLACNIGSGALAIKCATLDMFKRMATKNVKRFRAKDLRPEAAPMDHDAALELHLRSITEFFTADAAADEHGASGCR